MSAPVFVACGAAVIALTLPILATAQTLELQQRAVGAADTAALAAADALNGWIVADPCAVAARVVVEMGVNLANCIVDDALGEARIIVNATSIFANIEARARAGPPPQ